MINNIDLKEIIEENKKQIFEIQICGDVITIHPNITYKEQCQMVAEMSKLLFHGITDENDEYSEIFREQFAICYGVLKYMSDVDVSDMTLISDFVATTDIFDLIMGVPNVEQYRKEAIESAKATRELINNYSKWDDVADLISALLDNLNKSFKQFENVDAEKLLKLADKFKDVDQKGIVKSILDFKKEEKENKKSENKNNEK